ncbi:hypothetical protein PIB30_113680, partial [Stylosanthes scabra]|nr:hypothetical protein [Stylosanthes scabra]
NMASSPQASPSHVTLLLTRLTKLPKASRKPRLNQVSKLVQTWPTHDSPKTPQACQSITQVMFGPCSKHGPNMTIPSPPKQIQVQDQRSKPRLDHAST